MPEGGRGASEEVVEVIAATVGIEVADVEDLLAVLQTRAQMVTVVIDAVDEAAEGDKLAGMLARLAATGGVRLLIGCRWHLVNRLVALEQAMDLNDPAYLEPNDVMAYVRRCLLLDGDPNAYTPYRNQPELAEQVAMAVAERAGGSFLVAQLVSLALVNANTVVDIAAPGWRRDSRVRLARQCEPTWMGSTPSSNPR